MAVAAGPHAVQQLLVISMLKDCIASPTMFNDGTVKQVRSLPLASRQDSLASLQQPETLAGHQATCTCVSQQHTRELTSRLASSSSSNLFSSAAAASFCAMSHCLQRQAGVVLAGSLAAGSGPMSGPSAGLTCSTSTDGGMCYQSQPPLQRKAFPAETSCPADVDKWHLSRT